LHVWHIVRQIVGLATTTTIRAVGFHVKTTEHALTPELHTRGLARILRFIAIVRQIMPVYVAKKRTPARKTHVRLVVVTYFLKGTTSVSALQDIVMMIVSVNVASRPN